MTIETYNVDITGDNQAEKIEIRGISKGKGYNKMFLDINSSNDKKYKFTLTGNQKPTILFRDLNHDHVKDLFIATHTKKDTSLSDFHLYSLKDHQFTNIELPETLSLTAQFEKDYQASIQIDQSGKVHKVDLSERKTNFDNIGLYQNGNLNEPTELIVGTFEKLKPVLLRDMSIGLKGRQTISEGYERSNIAYVDSTWKWAEGSWQLQNSVVKKINQKKKEKK